MKKDKDVVSIFVTGGWDSTFMLCKLSTRNFKIQPIYVFNKDRLSREHELASLRRIIEALDKHPNTKAKIASLKIIDLDEIRITTETTQARKNIYKRLGRSGGRQYEYLSTISKNIGPVGVGVEYSPPEGDTGETKILNEFTKLKRGSYGFVIDRKQSDPDILKIFGNMFFPIADITEPEMHNWAEKNGYSKIMDMTWFCHSPINDKPCGLCPSCEEKMGSKMEFLLPEEAKKRYFRAKRLKFFGRKLSRFIKKMRIKQLQKKTISN